VEHIFSCRYELGCSTRNGRTPSGAGIRISALKGRPRKRRDPPESPALQPGCVDGLLICCWRKLQFPIEEFTIHFETDYFTLVWHPNPFEP